MLPSVWTTNGGGLANHRCGDDAVSLYEKGYCDTGRGFGQTLDNTGETQDKPANTANTGWNTQKVWLINKIQVKTEREQEMTQ